MNIRLAKLGPIKTEMHRALMSIDKKVNVDNAIE